MIELNTIYNEDCLQGTKRISNKSIDMILCDLPYGTTACKWDVIIPFEPLWEQYERVIKDNGAIVLTASQPFTTDLINSNRRLYKYCWYWNKDKAGNFATAKYQPLRVVEDVVVFGGVKCYNPQMELAEAQNMRPRNNQVKQKSDFMNTVSGGFFKVAKTHNEAMRYPKNLINIKSTSGECNQLNRVHPTQKPVELFEYLIKTYTNEGQTVMDNCMGSGTTAIACINTNRNYIGFEIEEKYWKIANDRIKKHGKQQKLFAA